MKKALISKIFAVIMFAGLMSPMAIKASWKKDLWNVASAPVTVPKAWLTHYDLAGNAQYVLASMSTGVNKMKEDPTIAAIATLVGGYLAYHYLFPVVKEKAISCARLIANSASTFRERAASDRPATS